MIDLILILAILLTPVGLLFTAFVKALCSTPGYRRRRPDPSYTGPERRQSRS